MTGDGTSQTALTPVQRQDRTFPQSQIALDFDDRDRRYMAMNRFKPLKWSSEDQTTYAEWRRWVLIIYAGIGLIVTVISLVSIALAHDTDFCLAGKLSARVVEETKNVCHTSNRNDDNVHWRASSGESLRDVTDHVRQIWNNVLDRPVQIRFEFAEGRIDRADVRRIVSG
jgi:hypothetical protein